MGGHMDQGSHPDISRQSEFLHGTHAGQCDHRVRSLPNHDSTTSVTVSFKNVGLMLSVTEILLPDATKWSATSCGTVVLLLLRTFRSEGEEKRSSAGVITRGRPETCLLDTESSD
ncbi:hypothetical protein AVEN_45862-1 [Araneus ventricosus]|uniref:Uncharacterized protein n=1 Tax=Araneus ventricosus TaxID=182803 RepID=A0A4Y2HEA6_ARAVE|nr:hypothetical protein AVEN_45862-1 [Araneus ventricosus]